MRISFRNIWSATDFAGHDMSRYASGLLLLETRRGLMTMVSLMLVLQLATWLLQSQAGHGRLYFFTACMLGLLGIHMLLSATQVRDTRTLHMLAIVYLVISSTAIALIAHRMGAFNIGLMASSVLLVVVIPLMPWGLKEALSASLLIYFVFTLSSISVPNRFDAETIWTLQFLFLASSLIACALVGRNVQIRKHDIETRYDLEQEQRRQQLLALKDPLTGLWNRRLLTDEFERVVADARDNEYALQLALLDIDDFKDINDRHGHHCGDEILICLANILTRYLPGHSYSIRLGGDEFAILCAGDNLEENLKHCLHHLGTDPKLLRLTGGKPVRVSAGFAQTPVDGEIDLERLYRTADEQLYMIKHARTRRARPTTGRLFLRERMEES